MIGSTLAAWCKRPDWLQQLSSAAAALTSRCKLWPAARASAPLSVSTSTNDRVVHAILTLLPKNVISRGNGWNAMKKREMSPPRAGAANTTIKPESRDLSVAAWRAIMTETDTEIAPFIQNIGAASIAEIDRLIAELQEAKSYLQSEGERIEREMVRYANLTQMASFTAEVIS